MPVSDWQERLKGFHFSFAENGVWLFMLWCLSCMSLTLPEDCCCDSQRNCNRAQLHLPEKNKKLAVFCKRLSHFCLTVEFHFVQNQLTFQLFPLDICLLFLRTQRRIRQQSARSCAQLRTTPSQFTGRRTMSSPWCRMNFSMPSSPASPTSSVSPSAAP